MVEVDRTRMDRVKFDATTAIMINIMSFYLFS